MTQLQQFPGTPNFFAMLQPWVSYGKLSEFGAPIAIDKKSRRLVLFNPWELKSKGLINSTDFLLVGERGDGKTTIMKTLPPRLMAWQAGLNETTQRPEYMRTRIDDRKTEAGQNEYAPLTEALCGINLPLATASIDPFDPAMGMLEEDVYVTAVELCEYANHGKPIDRYERTVLRVAIWLMYSEAFLYMSPKLLRRYLKTLDLGHIRAYDDTDDADLMKQLAVMKQQAIEKEIDGWEDVDSQYRAIEDMMTADAIETMTEDELRHGVNQARFHLGELLRGEYGSFIGGTQSLREVLGAPVATFDWTGVPDKARALIESMRMKWEEVALNRFDSSITPHLWMGDEVSKAMQDLMHVRFESSLARTRRARHTAVFRSTQFATDLTMFGEPGSELRRLSEGIVNSFGAHIVGSQPDTDENKHELVRRHHITDADAQAIVDQQVGEFTWLVPNRPPLFTQYLLIPEDEKLVASDAAVHHMMTTIEPWNFSDALERAERAKEFVMVGENE